MKPTVISTFAGIGGSSLGYKLAGYKELLAIDFEPNAVQTFKLNFPRVKVWERDITKVTSKEILKETKLKVGELFLLDGSPPCQGFSMAGNRKVYDERNNLSTEFIRILKELQPKTFVMENVPGMIKGTMKGAYTHTKQELINAGYNITVQVMNSKYFNVPQSRERLIFHGIRKDLHIKPTLPKPENKPISVKEILKDITNKEIPEECYKFSQSDRYIQVINKIRPGQKGPDIDSKRSYFNTIRLHNDKICPTITKTKHACAGIIHSEEKRWLTIQELKAFASFPPEYKLEGTYKQQWAGIGNAVMPNFMKAIALHIKRNVT